MEVEESLVDQTYRVLLAEALDDRHGAFLDDEEVATGVAGRKQNLARLDVPQPTQLAPSRSPTPA